MTGFAATHTGSLTPSSDPWTFVGTVTWQSDIDPAILPDNEPVVLRLAFTTLSLTGARVCRCGPCGQTWAGDSGGQVAGGSYGSWRACGWSGDSVDSGRSVNDKEVG